MKRSLHPAQSLATVAIIAAAIALAGTAQAQSNIAPSGTVSAVGGWFIPNAAWGTPTPEVRATNGVTGWTPAEGIHGPSATLPTKIYITWLSDYDIDRVQISHCSAGEVFIARDYTIESLNPGGNPTNDADWTIQATITGNTTLVANHTFAAVTTKGIRLNLTNLGPSSGNTFRFEELEVFGVPSIDTTAPLITARMPADDATNVKPRSDLVATFDEGIALTGAGTITVTDLTDGTGTFTIDLAALPDPNGTVTVSGLELTINPTANLEATSDYAVQISADAIEDLSGNDFAGILNNSDWSFTTGIETLFITPVTALASSEWSDAFVNSANLVNSSGLSVNTENGTHESNGIAANMWFAGNVDGPLPGDPSGNPPIVADQEVVFDLGTGYNLLETYVWNQNQAGIFAAARGTEDFDIYVSADTDPLTASWTFLSSQTLVAASGASGEPAQVKPLAASDVRLVKFDIQTATSGAANEYVGLSEVRFEGVLADDFDPPTITARTPFNSETNVAVNTGLTASFNEVVKKGTGDIRVREFVGDATVHTIAVSSGDVTVSGFDVTVALPGNLTPGIQYYVEIDSGAIQDLSDNNFGIAGNGDWAFTTDGTAPLISTLSPADEATDVSLDTSLVATFDENIALTGAGSITLRNLTLGSVWDVTISLPDVTQVSVSGAQLTIAPSAILFPGNDYAVRISADAIADPSGNAFGGILNDTDWNFTTETTIRGVTIEDVSSEIAGFNRLAVYTVDGSGFEPNGPGTHSLAADGGMWLNQGVFATGTPDPLSTPPFITYDLGATYDLNGFTVWNYNETGITSRGANAVTISVAASEGGAFTVVTTTTFDEAPNDAITDFGQFIDLSSFGAAGNVRLVRIEITSNHGGDNEFVGLSEIRFDGQPAPGVYATWAATNGLSGGETDPDADTESDLLVNLLEFAFGTDPLVNDNSALVITDGSSFTPGTPAVRLTPPFIPTNVAAQFVRRKDAVAAGLTYVPEFSADLVTWETDPADPAPLVVSTQAGDYEVVEVPYLVLLTSGQKATYFRIRVNSTDSPVVIP